YRLRVLAPPGGGILEARRTDEIKAELNELLRQSHEVLDARVLGTANGSEIASQVVIGGAQMNNVKVRLGLVAFLVCVSMLLISPAQDTNDTSKLTRYVAGCLQQGHNADEYQLVAENAKWHLRSDSFRLEDYVGQEIKVA